MMMKRNLSSFRHLEISGLEFPLLVGNVILFAVQLLLTSHALMTQTGASKMPSGYIMPAADLKALPFPVVHRGANPQESIHLLKILVAVAQSGALLFLSRYMNTSSLSKMRLVAYSLAATVMATLALQSRTLTSFDAYAYIGYSKMSFAHAYAPVKGELLGSFEPISLIWGNPIIPCYYGPLWLAIQHMVVGPQTSFAYAVLTIRILSLLSIAATTWALFRLRISSPLIMLFLVNPFIWQYFIVDAHNDMLGVLFVVAGAIFAISMPALAIALVVAASLIKISLLALAPVVFCGSRRIALRTSYIIAAVALCGLTSVAFGGPEYVHSLFAHVAELNNAATAKFDLTKALLVRTLELLALVSLALVFFRGTSVRSGSWPLFILSGVVYPWYLIWALPYAALARRTLVDFVVLLPLVAVMLDSSFQNRTPGAIAIFLIIAIYLSEIWRTAAGASTRRVLEQTGTRG